MNNTPIIDQLAKQFPKTVYARCARTGWIPMDVFEKMEKEIRSEFKGIYRVFYRGPRISNNTFRGNKPTCTMRVDATHAVIYRK